MWGIACLIIFLGYLFNGEGENNLASHVEETKALELRFFKNVLNKEKHVGRSLTNVSFLCLLNIVKNKYWEYNHKPFKENNWKAFTNVMNASFLNDV